MAQDWTSQGQYQIPDPSVNVHSTGQTSMGYFQSPVQAPAAGPTVKSNFPFAAGGAGSGDVFQVPPQRQSLPASFEANQRVEHDVGELSDEFDGDECDPFDDDDIDPVSPSARLAGHSTGADAFTTGPPFAHLSTRASSGSGMFPPVGIRGLGQATEAGSSNVVTSMGQGSLGLPLRHRSPAPELQFPPGISGTPADFFDQGAGRTEFEGWRKMMKQNAGLGFDEALETKFGIPTQGRTASPVIHSPLDNQPSFDRPPKMKRNQIDTSSLGAGSQAVKVLVESTKPGEPPKKVKMHQCGICAKLFPRPSGLATHMNSHSGARRKLHSLSSLLKFLIHYICTLAFKCPLALCPKTFAVRSNARRHLRTHGITIPPPSLRGGRAQDESFHVGFETPVVIDVHDPSSPYPSTQNTGSGDLFDDNQPAGGLSAATKREETKGKKPKLRWVPQSLSDRTNAGQLRSISPASDMADIDAELGPLPSAHPETDGQAPANANASTASAHFSLDHGYASYSAFNFTSPHNYYEPHNLSAGQTEAAKPSQSSQALSQGLEGRAAFERGSLRVAPAPLPHAIPTDESGAGDLNARFEERNSFAEAGTQPYHPDQVSTSLPYTS